MNKKIYLPPEWATQGAIQLTWPHMHTDWSYMLNEATECFINIAQEILKRQDLMIVCHSEASVIYRLGSSADWKGKLILSQVPTNDTWNRDHGGISVLIDNKPYLYDFTFNGWGMKFTAEYDNQINRNLVAKDVFSSNITYVNKKDFVLEGGAIESDGKGTLLTTSECLLSLNRNSYLSKEGVEKYLKEAFGLDRVLWLDHGYLAGDDTDSHIDTLARFCDEHTIAYVKCDDKEDEHYEELAKMEEQLKSFVNYEGNPYKLIPLPMAVPVYDEDNDRLPATYANFLIMNDAVLVPTYGEEEMDKLAMKQLQLAFPQKEIVGVNCSALIKQHGSLHCVTMQFPKGYFK